jgi:hypothetical protein
MVAIEYLKALMTEDWAFYLLSLERREDHSFWATHHAIETLSEE